MEIVNAQPQLIAAVRRHSRFPEASRVMLAGLDVVWPVIRSNGLFKGGHNVAIYRHLGDGAVDLTCGVQISERFEAIGEVECAETPSGEAATATHVGRYDRLGETYDAIVAWVRESGRLPARVNWEIYGDWNDDPSKVETTVYMLLEPQ